MADVTVTAVDVRPLKPSMVSKGVAAAALTLGQVVYLNSSEQWAVADSDAAATSLGLLGLVVAGGQAKDDGSVASGDECAVLTFGRVAGFSGLNGTTLYYLSGTAGKIADAAGTVTRFLGHAEAADVFFFHPDNVATS